MILTFTYNNVTIYTTDASIIPRIQEHVYIDNHRYQVIDVIHKYSSDSVELRLIKTSITRPIFPKHENPK